jgi:hypothetical protein
MPTPPQIDQQDAKSKISAAGISSKLEGFLRTSETVAIDLTSQGN